MLFIIPEEFTRDFYFYCNKNLILKQEKNVEVNNQNSPRPRYKTNLNGRSSLESELDDIEELFAATKGALNGTLISLHHRMIQWPQCQTTLNNTPIS